MEKPLVLAFGGNALLPDPENPGTEEKRAEDFARALKLLLPRKAGVALVHGNGPQVGMILLRIEATRDRIPPETLDVLVAETQGSIGYVLSKALRNKLPEREVAAVLTQVVVDSKDPGFLRPTKPVGPYYSREEAERLKREISWSFSEAPGRGWRRVVPSPKPERIIEIHTIRDALSHGHVIIAGGGGGIPVIADRDLHGAEAVIDKDLTAGLLAKDLKAGRFVILTDVPHISLRFGKSSEEPLERMTVDEARRLISAGEFPEGSMGPKVEACADYVEATGKPALITDVDSLGEALEGKEGTWIIR